MRWVGCPRAALRPAAAWRRPETFVQENARGRANANAPMSGRAGAMTADQIMELMIEELGPDDMIEIADKMREAAPSRQAEQALIVS